MQRKPRCSICKKAEGIYRAGEGFKRFCGAECGAVLALQLKAKRDTAKVKEVNKEYKKRKEALLTVSDWTKKAQVEFNKYIRQRDYDKPCVSCGKSESELKHSSRGGLWDCGHYRSVGSCPELRFEPRNAHKQCKSCNNFLSGNVVEYRLGLPDRLCVDDIEWLEGPHELPRWRVDDLKEIYDKYKAMTKELKRLHNE